MRADAIVVLGCRILPSGRPTPAAEGRAATAARAFHDGVASRVIVSGGRRWGPQVEAGAISGALVLAGVPRAAIVRELWSLTTQENAVYTGVVLARLGEKLRLESRPRAVVVTCAWHMPRAIANFTAAGIDAIALPVHGAPVGAWTRAARRVHEALSGVLDRHLMRRAREREAARAATDTAGARGAS